MRYRVTIRGEGTEIRGYASEEALRRLASGPKTDHYIVVASEAEDDYNPFGPEVKWP